MIPNSDLKSQRLCLGRVPQLWIIGEPSDLRALLGYGEVAQRSQEGNPAPEAVKRTPSVLEMLVAGGQGECGRDLRAPLGHGEIAQRSQKGYPAPLVVKRTPSVFEMLIAGGHGEGGSHATPVGEAMSVYMAAEAISEQNEGTPTPCTEGGGGKNLRFKAKRGGGLEIVSEPKGTGTRSKCQETNEKANCQETGSEAASAECAGEHSDGQGPADKGGNSRANHSDGNCKDGTTPPTRFVENPRGGWAPSESAGWLVEARQKWASEVCRRSQ